MVYCNPMTWAIIQGPLLEHDMPTIAVLVMLVALFFSVAHRN